MKVLLVFGLSSPRASLKTHSHALFSPPSKLKNIKETAVYGAVPWRAHYWHACLCHGRNLTVSYNLKMRVRHSQQFYCRSAAAVFFLISHSLSKWKEHKSSVSLKSTTIRAGWLHLSSIITEDGSASRASEVGRGVLGNRIQVRQRATAQLIREGILGQVWVKLDTS